MNSISFRSFLSSSWKLPTGWTFFKTRAPVDPVIHKNPGSLLQWTAVPHYPQVPLALSRMGDRTVTIAFHHRAQEHSSRGENLNFFGQAVFPLGFSSVAEAQPRHCICDIHILACLVDLVDLKVRQGVRWGVCGRAGEVKCFPLALDCSFPGVDVN